MTSNDVVLLNSLLDDWNQRAPEGLSEAELFETFCIEQILRDQDLATEEILRGRTGGGNDGGIDGLFTFLNTELLEEDSEIEGESREANFAVYFVQATRTSGFEASAFDAAIVTLTQILDLSMSEEELEKVYGKPLIRQVMLFRDALVKLAGRHPRVAANFVLATKGSTSNVHATVLQKAEDLRVLMEEKLPNCSARTRFVGARELLEAARREPAYTLNLRFTEGFSLQDSYIMLVQLTDYFQFITDDSGALRRYIFEWNVRDYQGDVEVNADIRDALDHPTAPEFWWLNNGVTILTSKASITGKVIALSDVQIVNGLQTSFCIFQYLRDNPGVADERSILCRIVQTGEEQIRDRIIKATNFQTAVPAASLKATDPIQRDIEEYFRSRGWYYDRRKNYYKNLGKPADRIIGIPYLAQAVMAMGLSRPDDSRARPTSLIKRRDDYRRVFDSSVSLPTYCWAAETMKQTEFVIRSLQGSQDAAWEFRFHVATLAASSLVGERVYHPSQLGSVTNQVVGSDLLQACLRELFDALASHVRAYPRPVDRIAKSRDFVEELLRARFGERPEESPRPTAPEP